MLKPGPSSQKGILIYGPGGKRMDAVLSNLFSLTLEQQELVNKAKKYALDQSIKSLYSNKQQTATPAGIVPTLAMPLLPGAVPNQTTNIGSITTAAAAAAAAAVNINASLVPSSSNTTQSSSVSSQKHQKTLQRHQALVLLCRVYVGSISFELREESLKAAFSPYGAVKSVNMTWDPVTLKHKGFAFVEYELPEAAQLSLDHLNGVVLCGRQIRVGRPANIPQAAPVIQQIQEECSKMNRVYVANVHSDIDEAELKFLFDPFGKVRSCKLAITPDGDLNKHRGYGFIEFESASSVKEALTMEKFDLGGQTLHVCRATSPPEHISNFGVLDQGQAVLLCSADDNTVSDHAIAVQNQQTNSNQDGPAPVVQTSNTESSQNGQSTENVTNEEELANKDSTVVVLNNMVGPDEELDDALRVDVEDECGKYGPVKRVVLYLDKASSKDEVNGHTTTAEDKPNIPASADDKVKIFVQFDNNESACRARSALDGRFFGGRKISAQLYGPDLFSKSDYSH